MRKLFALFIVLLISGCSVSQQPVLQPFADAEYWVLKETMEYQIPNTNDFIRIPEGFVTDFASVPAALRPLFPKLGRYIFAAIIHDYLYWNQSCSKKQADEIFYLAMEFSNVGGITRKTFWFVVDTFGGKAWKLNAQRKSNGYVKVIPESYLDIPANQTWAEYLKQLQQYGVEDNDSGDFSHSCKLVKSSL